MGQKKRNKVKARKEKDHNLFVFLACMCGFGLLFILGGIANGVNFYLNGDRPNLVGEISALVTALGLAGMFFFTLMAAQEFKSAPAQTSVDQQKPPKSTAG
jgi:hypothetical protein